MGLDMYLEKHTYVKNWSHQGDGQRHSVQVLRGGVVRSDIKPERVSTIVEDVAYWRKANAVHRWFVAHVQNGVDDCRTYDVSREQLEELVRTCKEVLAKSELVPGDVVNGYTFEDGKEKPILEAGQRIKDPTAAKALMPTQSGFFFGLTDYDERYYEDLQETVRQLEPVLTEADGEFVYHSSW